MCGFGPQRACKRDRERDKEGYLQQQMVVVFSTFTVESFLENKFERFCPKLIITIVQNAVFTTAYLKEENIFSFAKRVNFF